MAYANFEECCRSLELLSDDQSNAVKLSIVKVAIVTYYRPFSGSNPIHRACKWKIDEAWINDSSTHEKAKEFRDHLIAHTDLEHSSPHLAKIDELYPISFKGFYFEDYMKLVEPLHNLAKDLCNVLKSKIKSYEQENF